MKLQAMQLPMTEWSCSRRAGAFGAGLLAALLAALLLFSTPAHAFEPGAVPVVSADTEAALKNLSLSIAKAGLAVPYASSTIYDATPPTITLNGQSTVTVQVGGSYSDAGATAHDSMDGDVTGRLSVVNPVNTAVANTYTVTYNVSDTAGNAAQEVTRKVVVGSGDLRTLALPSDLKAKPGDTVTCPVNLDRADGLSAYDFHVTFDATVLEVTRAVAGTLTSSWSAPAVTLGSSSVRIRASGAALASGSGSVAVVTFKVKDSAKNKQTSPLGFTGVSLNNGAITALTAEGLLTVLRSRFVWGDTDGDGQVTTNDSQVILKHRVGLVSPLPITAKMESADDLGGADVSGDVPPFVGTVDASLILRRLGGKLAAFPTDIDGDGEGPDVPKTVDEIRAKLVDYIEPGMVRVVRAPGSVQLDPGVELQAPIEVDSAVSVMGYFVEVMYDSRALRYVNTSKGALTQAWMEPAVNAEVGRVRIAGAGPTPLSGTGSLALLTFQALDTVAPGASTVVYLAAAELNDHLLPVEAATGRGEPMLAAVDPARGAETGGTVVRLTGVNLANARAVYFGDIPAPWFRVDRSGGSVLAMAPAGGGRVAVRVEGPTGSHTLPQAYTYFVPQVHLTMAPEETVELGGTLQVPIWAINVSGSGAARVSFVLNFDPTRFAPRPTGGGVAVLGDAATGGRVRTRTVRPGQIEVIVEHTAAGINSGLLCTCRLVAIGSTEGDEGLIYLTQTAAEASLSKALSTAASIGAR